MCVCVCAECYSGADEGCVLPSPAFVSLLPESLQDKRILVTMAMLTTLRENGEHVLATCTAVRVQWRFLFPSFISDVPENIVVQNVCVSVSVCVCVDVYCSIVYLCH